MSTEPHDQTRGDSTPYFQDRHSAPLSCNEVAALCMKAARGAGMSWGMAEEAGFAAAWLVSHGIDGPTHLRAHLESARERHWSDLCPSVTAGTWGNAAGHPLCPIILGATMCDYAALPEGPVAGCSILLGAVSHPILLTPFLADVAQANGVSIAVAWSDGSVRIGQGDAWPAAVAEALCVPERDLTLTATTAPAGQPCPSSAPSPRTGAETIAALNDLAMRTTVPASAVSRAGAGSTLSDND